MSDGVNGVSAAQSAGSSSKVDGDSDGKKTQEEGLFTDENKKTEGGAQGTTTLSEDEINKLAQNYLVSMQISNSDPKLLAAIQQVLTAFSAQAFLSTFPNATSSDVSAYIWNCAQEYIEK